MRYVVFDDKGLPFTGPCSTSGEALSAAVTRYSAGLEVHWRRRKHRADLWEGMKASGYQVRRVPDSARFPRCLG